MQNGDLQTKIENSIVAIENNLKSIESSLNLLAVEKNLLSKPLPEMLVQEKILQNKRTTQFNLLEKRTMQWQQLTGRKWEEKDNEGFTEAEVVED